MGACLWPLPLVGRPARPSRRLTPVPPSRPQAQPCLAVCDHGPRQHGSHNHEIPGHCCACDVRPSRPRHGDGDACVWRRCRARPAPDRTAAAIGVRPGSPGRGRCAQPRGATGRVFARHPGVLQLARQPVEAPDRRTGVFLHRHRGRLGEPAATGPLCPLPPGRPRFGTRGPATDRTLAKMGMGQQRAGGTRRVAAGVQSGATARAPCWHTRDRHLRDLGIARCRAGVLPDPPAGVGGTGAPPVRLPAWLPGRLPGLCRLCPAHASIGR